MAISGTGVFPTHFAAIATNDTIAIGESKIAIRLFLLTADISWMQITGIRACGYDPLNSYSDYNGPIYTYGNLLPDEVIANVRVALQDAGYYFGPVTRSLSVETRAALANYQRDHGLIITRAIDQPTIESLGLY